MPQLTDITEAGDFELLTPNSDLIKYNESPVLYLGVFEGKPRILRRIGADIAEVAINLDLARFTGGGIRCLAPGSSETKRTYSLGERTLGMQGESLKKECKTYHSMDDLLVSKGI